MNWNKSLVGVSVLFALILSACGPTNVVTEVATEAPGEVDGDTPVITEEDLHDEDMADETEEPMASGDPTVILVDSALGKILVDPDGLTLYMFVNDSPNESACYDSCAANWPPLLVDGEPVAGEGIDQSLLGTTERTDGTQQVTYNSLPLYYYVQDSAAGDTNGQGVGGAWYVVNPSGEAITAVGEDLPDY